MKAEQHLGSKSQGASTLKLFLIRGVLALLLCVSPMACLWVMLEKRHRATTCAMEEFQRSVYPDELRAWASDQIKKHPEGGYNMEARDEWPATFPTFPGSHFNVHLNPLRPDGPKADDWLSAVLTWDFGSEGFQARVHLNSNGTPVELEDEREWVEGISIWRIYR